MVQKVQHFMSDSAGREQADSEFPHSSLRSLSKPGAAARTIVVVGQGMVGQRFCEEVRARRSLNGFRVVAFGEEATEPYDRVHLARVIRGEARSTLRLRHLEWHQENRVRLVIDDPVVELDRENKLVRTRSRRVEHYEHLVLATGAKPVLGNLPGIEGRDVRALRTVDDAEAIHEKAVQCIRHELPVVIVGGGLLGIELADELVHLGAHVIVLESAQYPLSRQLEKSAGEMMAEMLRGRELEFRSRVRVLSLEEQELGTLVQLQGESPILAGLVVPAMGIRARDQLARDAGLSCDLFGGIEVDDELLSSDPSVSAIGECARHKGMAYGLVAPGYAMAEAVARRLAGQKAAFSGVQVGTRLKVTGLDLTVVGESSATGLGTRSVEYHDESNFRRLAVRSGRVIGITCLGNWTDLSRAQEAMARSEKLRPVQLKRFEKNEPMWKRSELSLLNWPDSATVCTCMGVTCGTLKRAVAEGCANAQAIAEHTGASTVCGSCLPLLATLTEEQVEEVSESPWMTRLSLVSLFGALLFVLAPSIPYAPSVTAMGIDALFRESLLKQITGFTTAALFLTSAVFSMRKRLSWLRWGDFEAWRVVHALIGVFCLVGALAHTGFRLGTRLDMALILVFLGSTFLGGVAGGWSLLESSLSPARARSLRGVLIRSHIFLLWPLPVLLLVHIAKVYFF